MVLSGQQQCVPAADREVDRSSARNAVDGAVLLRGERGPTRGRVRTRARPLASGVGAADPLTLGGVLDDHPERREPVAQQVRKRPLLVGPGLHAHLEQQ